MINAPKPKIPVIYISLNLYATGWGGRVIFCHIKGTMSARNFITSSVNFFITTPENYSNTIHTNNIKYSHYARQLLVAPWMASFLRICYVFRWIVPRVSFNETIDHRLGYDREDCRII